MRSRITELWMLLVLGLPTAVYSQAVGMKRTQSTPTEIAMRGLNGADTGREQQRAFALSLVISLAEEMRSYNDLALRSRVFARAADTVWDVDNLTARALFNRAWEAAVKGDAEAVTVNTKDKPPPAVMTLRRVSGKDLRLEVLSLVARRDRALAEELLAKSEDSSNREVEDANSKKVSPNGPDFQAGAKRLQLAGRLLADDQIEQALEVATPALDQVNSNSIGFLSALRRKNAEAADQRFALLLARAELDPLSDANTALGLSSYVFTPGLYVTFSADGSVRWTQPDEPTAAPNLPSALRNRFLQATGNILLRPLPLPEQDFTSSGGVGKSMAIKRLLPFFDQYAPDTATALRAQLTILGSGQAEKLIGDDNPLMRQGLAEEPSSIAVDKLQDRLDHARTSSERDRIYADAAVALATMGNDRARDFADKIDNSERRDHVRQYVDFELVRFAIRKKDAAEIARLARAGQLTHTQRSWAYLQASKLLANSQRPRSLELMGDAVDEARRTDADDPNRACLLIAAAKQFIVADSVRAWEVAGEAVKVANSIDKFSGENVELIFPMMTNNGLKFTNIGGEEFGLSGLLRLLTEDDLYRASDLARNFKNAAPRAVAVLAVARAVMEKK